MLALSVPSAFHPMPWCPKVVSTRYGQETQGSGFLLLSLVSPSLLLYALQGLPNFTLGKIWSYILSVSFLSFGPNLCGRWDTAGGDQLPPKKKIQFDILNYHSLHTCLLTK